MQDVFGPLLSEHAARLSKSSTEPGNREAKSQNLETGKGASRSPAPSLHRLRSPTEEADADIRAPRRT